MSAAARQALLGGAAFLVVLSAALWWSGRGEGPGSTATPSLATPSAGLRWLPGSQQQYDVRVDATMRVAGAGGTQQDLRLAMSCVLDWLTLESGLDAAWVGLRLASVAMSINGNSDPQLNEALTIPFRARFSQAGIPEAFEFPAGVTAENRTTLENLIRTFQVTAQTGEAWTARETNATGSYEAVYRRITPTSFEKRKQRFEPSRSVPMYTGMTIASTEAFSLEPGRDWLASMSVDETMTPEGQGGPGLTITNRSTLALRAATRVSTARDAWTFTASAAPPPSAGPLAEPPQLSPEEASRQIRAAVADLDDAEQGRTAFIHRLRDLLRVDDSQPGTLLGVLQTEELTDRTRADLYLAFELAGTAPAQDALSSVVNDPAWSTLDAMRAIVALGGVTEPTTEAIDTLWVATQSSPATEDGRQRASTATFALGTLGNSMSASGAPEYSALRSQLLSGAMSRGTGSQQANYVHALGNTRDPSLAGDVVTLLDAPEPEVRRAAALSLGMLDADHGAEPLLERFEKEPNTHVRGAIAEALVNWSTPTPEAVDTIRDGIRGEVDENTRYNMALFLSKQLAAHPDNRAVLQELLRSEQSRRIRQSVAEALAAPL